MTRTHRGPALKILLLLHCALQKCLGCNESLYGLTGSLFSPNYPQTSGVCSCSWNITVPVGYRVRLTFVHVNVTCAYGGIEFIDKGVVRKLCDSGTQTTVSEFPHRQVQVKYYSHSFKQAHGFFAHFKAISLSGANETTCPTGFQEYSNACYHTSRYLYNDRLDYCKSRESSLLSIEDTQENLFAVASLALLTPQTYLLLGMDKNSTGDYVWRDGSPLIHTNWKSGHPTKQGRPKLEENGEWSDGIVPESYFVFVCKKKLSGPSLPCNVTQLSRGILKLEASHVTGHSQWSVTVKNNEHWLQVDFNEVMISGIAITSYDAMKSNWIRNLTLAFSRYGNVFVPYTNPMKQIVVLQANRDTRNIVMNNLANPFIARNVRLYPDQWNNGINVDVRLYGCVLSPPADKCDLPLGVGNGAVFDAMITSSDSSPSRFDARLNLDLGLATAWLPSKPTNQWIQFKFDVRMTISGIATQGNSNGAWVTKYYVLYSAESPFSHMVLRFVKEYGTDQPKVFIGNTNQMSVARQTFKMPITTHAIRVLPVAYHGRAAMRLELYGCQSAFTPLPPHCGKPVRIVDLPVKTTTKFSSGTLNLDDGWFWETRNTTNPWIQVRLKMQMNITALETKGSIQYESWVTNYTLQYSSNGGQLQDFKYKGESVNFVGNVDGSSIIHHELSTPFLADTVRLSPTGWFGDRISLTMKLYECSALDHQECSGAIGHQAFRSIIASSYYDDAHAPHYSVPLDSKGGWRPRTNSDKEWIQVDFGDLVNLTAISTKGHGDSWVTKYRLEHSRNGTKFARLYKTAGIEVLFIANVDSDTEFRQILSSPLNTRFLRIFPLEYHHNISLRLGFCGCSHKTAVHHPKTSASSCNASVGMEYGYYLPSNIYSSSEEEKKVYGPSLARLSSAVGEAWTAMQNDAYQWLQVDFNSMQNVKYIATQGKVGTQERVKSYNLKHGNEQSTLKFIEENGKVKEFIGNDADADLIVRRALDPMISTRYIRVIPVTWNLWISMRLRIENQFTQDLMKNIDDSLLAASTSFIAHHATWKARLRFNFAYRGIAWIADKNDPAPWLMVDFLAAIPVTGIATQGAGDLPFWVTSYCLQLSNSSDDGYLDYKENEQTRVFAGNMDENNISINFFNREIQTRHVKIIPISWYHRVSLRVDFYGCKHDQLINITYGVQAKKEMCIKYPNNLHIEAFINLTDKLLSDSKDLKSGQLHIICALIALKYGARNFAVKETSCLQYNKAVWSKEDFGCSFWQGHNNRAADTFNLIGNCSQRTITGHCCVFPFKFNNTQHYSCVPYGNGSYWCSLTPNFQVDGISATCSPVAGNYTTWGEWSACSVTCGTGTRMRMRNCTNPAPLYGDSCHGDDKESESCSVTPSCKGIFSEWSRWGPCNATCGPGVKMRTMNFTSFASPHCQGSLTVVRKCDNLCCPDHNDTTGYTVWSAWGPCNRTCLGISERTRNFTNYLLHDKCNGTFSEYQACNVTCCPSLDYDEIFTSWSVWGECNASCTGYKNRTRSHLMNVLAPYCKESLVQFDLCNDTCCPRDDDVKAFNPWGPWGPCNSTGYKLRNRTYVNQNLICDNGLSELRQCNATLWGNWSECSQTCGTGFQTRIQVNCIAANCLSENRTCNNFTCPVDPVDGNFTEWTSWSTCTRTCGAGTQWRMRTCTKPPAAYGGLNCSGPANQTQECETQPCPVGPVNGNFTEWTKWTTCTRTCGTGTQWRMRTCTNPAPANGGLNCSGPANQTQECETQLCPDSPLDGNFTEWTKWTTCTRTCGTGAQMRMRTCTNPAPANGGLNCSGPANQTQECSKQPCPVDGNWTEWSTWSYCNRPCGTGYENRSRFCSNPPPMYGGKDCKGEDHQAKTCNKSICPGAEATFEMRFTEEKCSQDLSSLNSPVSQALVKKIILNVESIYRDDSTYIKTVVHNFRVALENPCVVTRSGPCVAYNRLNPGGRKPRQNVHNCGSVVAFFTVAFSKINSLQLITMYEHIATSGKLTEMPVTLANTSTKKVPGSSPVFTYAQNTSSTSIYLEWLPVYASSLHGQPLSGYSIFYREDSTPFTPDSLKSVPSVHSTTINGLNKFSLYSFRILAFTSNGNGIPSAPITAMTDEDVPSQGPTEFKGYASSSTTLTFSWGEIPPKSIHGILRGYNLSYTSLTTGEAGYTLMRPDRSWKVVQNLGKFTEYKVTICGFTIKGCGAESNELILRTFEDVPSVAPGNVGTLNLTSMTDLRVSWSAIPPQHANGILHKYEVRYSRIKTSKKAERKPRVETMSVGPSVLGVTLRDLVGFSVYEISVRAVTSIGPGPASITYGETCRCPSVIYTNYWLLSPYTRPFNSTVSGLLPQIIQNMTAWVCESCSNGHGPTRLDFRNKDEYGGPALKASMAQVAEDITVGTKISFPLNGNKYMTKYPGGLPFFPLVMSPGVAFLAREETIESSAKSMFFSVLKCFPMIGFSLMLVYIAGFIIWLLDSRANDSCFPRGFVAGTYEGMWWSYISVTTVGYGDRSPKTVGARLFAIIWTLYGLVLISFITSAITTSLTSVTMATEIMLYGTDVAAIQNSSEYRLGILKNAKVHGYANLEEIHQALLRGEVKGALVDTYVVGSYKAMLSSGQIRVDRVLERSFGYGLVLSGQAVFLQDEFKNYMLYNSAKISRLVETSTSKVKVPFKSVAETKSTGLFDSGASMFRNSLLSSGSLLAFLTFLGLAWHFLWHKRRRNIITNKVESWENNRAIKLKRETHAELREVVEQFYSNIMTNISQLSRWHRQEQRDLLAARKAQRRQPREVSTTHLKTLSFVNLDDRSDEKQSSEC